MLSNESENGGGALGGGGDEGVKSVLRPGKKCVGFVLAELDVSLNERCWLARKKRRADNS